MPNDFPFEQLRSLFLEYVRNNPRGSYHEAANGIAELAANKGVFDPRDDMVGKEYSYAMPRDQATRFREAVRQLFWQYLGKGLLVFGMNEDNPNWPWYRLTEHGIAATERGEAQPYDPDQFLAEFKQINEAADPVITAYLEEAVRAFYNDLPLSAAVMLGGASEKTLLLLHDAVENAIADNGKKQAFQKSYRWTIHSKYAAIRDLLDQMDAVGNLTKELAGYSKSGLPGAFELIRRQRNEAGHPELNTGISRDTVFLNLRVFTEYVRVVYEFIDFFGREPADW